eukprot:5601696-Pleurochrysis_carterae.AAC.1
MHRSRARPPSVLPYRSLPPASSPKKLHLCSVRHVEGLTCRMAAQGAKKTPRRFAIAAVASIAVPPRHDARIQVEWRGR